VTGQQRGFGHVDTHHQFDLRAGLPEFSRRRDATPSPLDLAGANDMLGEKFILFLETLISANKRDGYPDGAPRVISTSPHVPVKLPSPT
jgi:hypothetical protein